MYQTRYRFGGPLTPVVKKLLIINIAIFVLQLILPDSLFVANLALSNQGIMDGKYWQIFTYMFLHGGIFHIFFNLFALWMFGGDLERIWGSKYFLTFYLVTGLGAGFFIAGMNYFMSLSNPQYNFIPTVGASGALYAMLLAYGMTWPNREVLIYFLFPMKMKYVVLVFGLIEFFGTLGSMGGMGGNVSHIGHLGGLVVGFAMLKMHGYGLWSLNIKLDDLNFIKKILRRRRLQKKQQVINDRIRAKRIIDELLEKIAREGVNSLTPKEKRDLEWARKNYYPGDNETLH